MKVSKTLGIHTLFFTFKVYQKCIKSVSYTFIHFQSVSKVYHTLLFTFKVYQKVYQKCIVVYKNVLSVYKQRKSTISSLLIGASTGKQ